MHRDLKPANVLINSRGQVALTFQENNGVAIIEGRTGEVTNIFSAGSESVEGIDTAEDGTIDQSGSISDTPREPDAEASPRSAGRMDSTALGMAAFAWFVAGAVCAVATGAVWARRSRSAGGRHGRPPGIEFASSDPL